MKLTREQAIENHRKMWEWIREKVGDEPGYKERITLKRDYVNGYFQGEYIFSHCFLCEYAKQERDRQTENKCSCEFCAIDWGTDNPIYACENGKVTWFDSPISEILALPEREGV